MKTRSLILSILLLSAAVQSLMAQWSSTSTTASIYRTGNVGIGTTGAPTAKFETSNGSSTAPMYFKFDPTDAIINFRFLSTTTASNNAIVDITNKRATGATSNGGSAMLTVGYDASNVISSPALSKSTLVLRTDDVYSAFLSFGNNNLDNSVNYSSRIFEVDANAGQKYAKMDLSTQHADNFRWLFDGSEKMRINSAGNVGIGKTPTQKLDVNGIVNATGFYLNNEPFVTTQWTTAGSNINYNGGVVSIGTTTAPSAYKLAVGGKIVAEEVVVKLQANWPDYVFESDYKLPSLEELQLFIAEHKHLPGIPSAKEIQNNGVAVGELNVELMKKVEELTLYIIQLNKELGALNKKIETLENK